MEQSPGHPPALRLAGEPVVVLCLIGWVINDHVLKGLYGNWLTGKLSDVFGLVVFPVLVAVIVEWRRRPPRSALPVSIVATGIFFVAINLSAATSDAVAGLLSLVVPSKLTPDPTDLLVLPALAVPNLLLRRLSTEDPGSHDLRALVGRLALGVGLVASVATAGEGFDEGSQLEFTGSAIVSADQPVLEIPFELFFDGRPATNADSESIAPRWDTLAFGAAGEEGARLEATVGEIDAGKGVVRYELINTAAGPVELEWELIFYARKSDDSEPTVTLDAPPDERITPLAVAELKFTNLEGESELTEWKVSTTSNTSEISIGLFTTEATVLAFMDHETVTIRPGRTEPIPLPPDCPSAGCEFSIWLSDTPDERSDVNLYADGEVAVEAKQHELKIVGTRTLRTDEVTIDGETTLAYDVDVEIPGITAFNGATDYVNISPDCSDEVADTYRWLGQQCRVVGDLSYRAEQCCQSDVHLSFRSFEEGFPEPVTVYADIVVTYWSTDENVSSQGMQVSLTAIGAIEEP